MSYTAAPATRLLATHCCSCGRPLVDSISVNLGIGPECRKGYDAGISPVQQDKANILTREAAVACQQGRIERVLEIADEIDSIGLEILGDKIRRRFVNAERNAKIKIVENNGTLSVETPYKRKGDFAAAWRAIPGRRWNRSTGKNEIPVNQKQALWNLLKEWFPGDFGNGPQGLFRIPA